MLTCAPSPPLPPLSDTHVCALPHTPPHTPPWLPSRCRLRVHTLCPHTQTPPRTPMAHLLPWMHIPLFPMGSGHPATGAVSSPIPPVRALLAVTPEGLVSEPKSQVAEAGEVLGPEQRDGRVRPLWGHGEAFHPSARVHHQLRQEWARGILRPVAAG